MPAKKAASKQRKKAGSTRKKVASGKASGRKKVSARKKTPVSRKKAKTSKKSATRKKPAAKKSTAKKSAKKKSAKKKSTAGKSAKKKSASRKAAAKKVSKKKAPSKKAASRKKVTRKKPAARKKPASGKKAAASRKKSRASGKKSAATSKRKAAPKRKVTPARKSKLSDVLSGPIHGIEPYQPRRGEDYMNEEQRKHFREILLSWKRELMNEVDRTLHHMQDEAANFPDPNDRATQESEFGLELRTRDRERKLLRKINAALTRIDEGTYGYCEETGEEIGLKRLEARPVATLCVEAQERREMAERQFRDREDRYR